MLGSTTPRDHFAAGLDWWSSPRTTVNGAAHCSRTCSTGAGAVLKRVPAEERLTASTNAQNVLGAVNFNYCQVTQAISDFA